MAIRKRKEEEIKKEKIRMQPALNITLYESCKEIIAMIADELKAERIYLLGVTYTKRRIVTIFNQEEIEKEEVSSYHLLILTGDIKSNETVQEKVDHICKDFVSITCWTLSLYEFQKRLNVDDRFALTVFRSAQLCFNSGKTEYPTISNEEQKINDLKIWQKRANEFLVGAELYLLRKEYRLASFLLHQSIEQSYIGRIYNATAYLVKTHNLDRLHSYCLLLSFQVDRIFPRNTENEERLFQLLKSSYVNSRYKNDYFVAVNDISILRDKVKCLVTAEKK